MMNFQLPSQQRLFISKVEFSISEGVPASKVFTTWGVRSDWKLRVGLGPCTEDLEYQARSQTFPCRRGDWKPQRPGVTTLVFCV